MNTCDSCKHWIKVDDEVRHFGICNPPDFAVAKQVIVIPKATLVESVDSDLVFTEAKFGCIHWEGQGIRVVAGP